MLPVRSGRLATLTFVFAALLTATVWHSPVRAGIVAGYLPVTLEVTGTCYTVTATPLNFGATAAPPSGQYLTASAQATISLSCANGTSYSIDLGAGSNPDAGSRRLAGPFGSYVGYTLYQDNTYTIPWGTAVGGTLLSGTTTVAGAADHVVYGTTLIDSSHALGAYTDTVVITVTY